MTCHRAVEVSYSLENTAREMKMEFGNQSWKTVNICKWQVVALRGDDEGKAQTGEETAWCMQLWFVTLITATAAFVVQLHKAGEG